MSDEKKKKRKLTSVEIRQRDRRVWQLHTQGMGRDELKRELGVSTPYLNKLIDERIADIRSSGMEDIMHVRSLRLADLRTKMPLWSARAMKEAASPDDKPDGSTSMWLQILDREMRMLGSDQINVRLTGDKHHPVEVRAVDDLMASFIVIARDALEKKHPDAWSDLLDAIVPSDGAVAEE